MNNIANIRKLFVVVDMVKGFVEIGPMSDKKIAKIVGVIKALLKRFSADDQGLAFVNDAHLPNSLEFQRYPTHCLKDTEEAEIVDDLKLFERQALVYEKNSTSAIFNDTFINDLKKMILLDEVIIVGCCTDICVLNLAIPLRNYFDQNDLDIKVTVLTDAVETYHSDDHDRDEYNDIAFKLMKQAGILLRKSEVYL
ncbi:MAG: isochorismatase family cysteine hydrolase [Erysipelotrichaceae bacterium]|nr:isochorismatase family cysteine hydrolase [Erysipelotrichaceae bacterium]